MGKNSVSQREDIFCYYCAAGQSPREAAFKAGYPSLLCEGAGARLLRQERIREKIDKYSKERALRCAQELARSGLERIALGSVSDVLRLMLSDEADGPIDPDGMDLFNVAEIKRPKGGGFEVKFFDRIRALEKLAAIGENGGGQNGASSFYEALKMSAAAIGAQPPEDE